MSEERQPVSREGEALRWQAPKPPARKSGQKGIMLVAGAVLLTLTAAGVGAVTLFDVTRVHLGYDAAKAAYLKEGLPWSADDLAVMPPVSDDQNAGPELARMIKEYEGLKGGEAPEVVTQDDSAAAELYLAKRSMLLDRVRSLLKSKKGLDFKRDWSQGSGVSLGELGPMKGIVKDLCLRAELRTLKGEKAEALSDLEGAVDLAVRANVDQVFISGLVSSACRILVSRSARIIASQRKQDGDLLRTMEQIIRPLESKIDSEGIIRAEAYMHLWALRNMKALGGIAGLVGQMNEGSPKPTGSLVDAGDVSGIAERSMAVRSFEFWTEAAEVARKRPGDSLYLFDRLDRMSLEADMSNSSSMAHFKVLLPMFGQAGAALMRHEAEVRATRAALLAWAERSEGREAASLRQLKGGPWRDPFSDEEFKAKFEKEKVLIWSVGRNLKDQGGAPDTMRHLSMKEQRATGDDVAVQIPDLALEK